MLSVASGHTAGYLLNEVGKGRENYYLDATTEGEPPGLWWGAGAAEFGLAGEVDAGVMTAMFANYLDPRDPLFADPETRSEAARMGRAPRQYKDASGPQAVAFHDLTFSVPKSVTLLHTAYARKELDAQRQGDTEAAARWAGHRHNVESAIWAGNNAMLTHMQEVAGYATKGRRTSTTAQRVDAHRWTVASFFQHTSRTNDPQLHIHNAVWNRVVCDDGQVRAVDAQLIYQAKQGAGTLGERVMQEHLSRAEGTTWCRRPDGVGFEVAGVSQADMDRFSSRTTAISRATAEKVDEFREHFGREPSAMELDKMRRRATLVTRPGKSHDGETRAEQLDRWARGNQVELTDIFGRLVESVGQHRSPSADDRSASVSGRSVADVVTDSAGGVADGVADGWSPDGVIEQALAAAQDKRAAFGRSELQREVILALPPTLGTRTDASTVEVVARLTDMALARAVQVAGETDQAMPDGLTLADGTSAYAKPGGARYATTGHLVAEQALRRAAVERGRMAVSEAEAAPWIETNTAGRWTLGDDQAAAVRGLLTSGAAVSVLVGPAGAGKSRSLGAFAEGWSDLTGGRVFGLATSQRATEVLAGDGVQAMNTARWLATQKRLHGGSPNPKDEPYRLSRIDVVVIDEASMVDTKVIEEVRALVDQAGGRLVLAGDPRQLAAVGAGGGMALVTDRADTHHLTEVRRFEQQWEAEASLRLRAGDRDAIDEYDRRGRVLDGGTAAQAGEKAARAYVGDVLAGKQSVIVTATNGEAATVAAHVRERLADLDRVGPTQTILGMDGNECGPGDLVQARDNNYRIGVINRGRYIVEQVREDGSMVVRAEDGSTTHTLPAGYVAEHVTLGYAGTVHAVEGITVDRGHAVASAGVDPAALYVMNTRGRESNTLYVATRSEVADAPTGETAGNEPRTPADVLAGILEAERETTAAALQVAEDDAARAASMATIQARQEAGTRAYGELRTAQWLDRMASEGVLSETDRRALASDQGTAQLSRLLRAVEQAGGDPERALREAVAGRTLDDARSVAQVVHHRIASTHDLTPRLEQGAVVPADAPEEWRAHLQALADRADDRRRELGTQTAEDPPRWAVDALGPVPDDVVARAEWEHRAGAVAAHREATGYTDEARALDIAPGLHATERRASWHEAWAALGRPDASEEEHNLSDGALRNRQAAWERERAAAPPPIHDQQRALGMQIAKHEQDAAILAARADAAADQAEAEQLRQAAEDRATLAEVMRDRAAELEQVRDVQAQWYVDTAVTRELGERAEQELAARGKPMGDEPDRTTAEEWLVAEREARVQDDPHREIHESDVVDGDQAGARNLEERQPELTEEPDTDVKSGPEPAMPRGVPTADEVDAAVAIARARAEQLADRASLAEDNASTEQASREQAWRARDAADAEMAAETSDSAEYA